MSQELQRSQTSYPRMQAQQTENRGANYHLNSLQRSNTNTPTAFKTEPLLGTTISHSQTQSQWEEEEDTQLHELQRAQTSHPRTQSESRREDGVTQLQRANTTTPIGYQAERSQRPQRPHRSETSVHTQLSEMAPPPFDSSWEQEGIERYKKTKRLSERSNPAHPLRQSQEVEQAVSVQNASLIS